MPEGEDSVGVATRSSTSHSNGGDPSGRHAARRIRGGFARYARQRLRVVPGLARAVQQSTAAVRSQVGLFMGDLRVIRGGSWILNARSCRAADRRRATTRRTGSATWAFRFVRGQAAAGGGPEGR